MAVTVKYKILFSIDVLHHYFLDNGRQHFESLSADEKVKRLGNYHIGTFLELVPTSECQILMRNLQLIYKNTATGVIVGTRTTEAEDRPILEIPNDAKFTFILKLRDGYFYNTTNLSLNIDRNKVYFFSNLGQTSAETLNLSKAPTTFQGGSTYESGKFVLSANGRELFTINKNTSNAANADLDKDIVADSFANNEDYEKGDVIIRTIGGIDQLFEAKIDDPNDTPADAPGNGWKKLRDLPLNYVNNNDRIAIQNKLFNFTLPNNTINATAELSRLDSGGSTLVQSDSIQAGTLQFQLDWRNQSPGRYTLKITNDDLPNNDPAKVIHQENFYLIDPMVYNNAFGIIDIHANRSDTNTYALLANDGSFQSTENQFIIRFKNRATIWRYIFSGSQSLQGNTELSVENGDDKILVTKEMHPLTANGGIALQLGDRRLPNASAKMIKPEPENNYSEIFIH